jgi:CheY-like chemotaxis protein
MGVEHQGDVEHARSGTTLLREPTIEGRVLVVEDDDAIRTMLLTVLEVAGYEALGVRTGLDALTTLTEWRPHVIVLDLFMPLTDGYELLSRKSERHDLASIPVIVVTSSTGSLASAAHLGVWAVLQRPHDVSHLRALIADAMCHSTRERAGPEDSTGGVY